MKLDKKAEHDFKLPPSREIDRAVSVLAARLPRQHAAGLPNQPRVEPSATIGTFSA
jgi:hypothetical protein